MTFPRRFATGTLASDFMRRATRDSICVFLYHEVSPTPSAFYSGNDLNVTPQLFERQITLIREYFNVVSPHQLLTGDFDTPGALITFDDGAPGYFEHALPALERHGIPSVVFMNMGPVKGEIFWPGLVLYLLAQRSDFRRYLTSTRGESRWIDAHLRVRPSEVENFLDTVDRPALLQAARDYHGRFAREAEIQKAVAGGACFLGNHLYNHYNAANLTDTELVEQFVRNHDLLAGYDAAVPFFSYPFGQPRTCFDRRTNRLISELGATRIFTAYPQPNRDPASVLLDRIHMTARVDSREAFVRHVALYHLLSGTVPKLLWSVRRRLYRGRLDAAGSR